MSDLFSQVARVLPPSNGILQHIWNDIVEAFTILNLPGRFVTYKDFAEMAGAKGVNVSSVNNIYAIAEKFGGLPVTGEAIKYVQQLAPELLPSYAPSDYSKYESDKERIRFYYYESEYGTIRLIKEISEYATYSNFLFFRDSKREFENQFYEHLSLTLYAFKSEMLVAKYYNAELDKMESISTGFWFAENLGVLWLQGKLLIKDKYVPGFVAYENYVEFLNSITPKERKIKDSKNNQDNDNIVQSLFLGDNTITTEKITNQNIESIKDSLSYRVFKLALICDAKGYRKTTNDTLADYIFDTQDWYFIGTHKTMTLAKKAASMIRAIDAAKGGTAQDIRKYCPKTKQIV
jgi:hypothetical protein